MNNKLFNNKKRNSQITTSANDQNNAGAANGVGGAGSSFTSAFKQMNNFFIDAPITASQIMNQPKAKQHSYSTKSSSTKGYGSGISTNK